MDGEAPAHLPVLVDEVMFLLRPRHGGWVVDGTIGMGGHAERLLETAPPATRLFGIDRDPEALARAGRRLAAFGARVTLRQGSFRSLRAHAEAAGVSEADTVLLDLGLSSYQLGESGRGFSFSGEEPLDMRFDPTRGATAAELLQLASRRRARPHPGRVRRGAPCPEDRPPRGRDADAGALRDHAGPRRGCPAERAARRLAPPPPRGDPHLPGHADGRERRAPGPRRGPASGGGAPRPSAAGSASFPFTRARTGS